MRNDLIIRCNDFLGYLSIICQLSHLSIIKYISWYKSPMRARSLFYFMVFNYTVIIKLFVNFWLLSLTLTFLSKKLPYIYLYRFLEFQ